MFSNVNMFQDDSSLNDLYLALTQCFSVIICGYIAGKTQLITPRETSGLNTFVGKFSLPSTIFLALCQLDLSKVNWLFILAIFVSKAIIFFLVMIITVVVTRPTNPARAGLLAIFCTQTNDFAIGVPIVAALYQKTHPEFGAYLYLLAPISLTILNPIGFVMMEIGKQPSITHNATSEADNSRWQMIRSVVRNIVMNPVVFMTVLGIIGNSIFNHNPPQLLVTVLNAFANAFTGTALMLLGLRMVGRVHTLQGIALLVPSLLVIAKLLVTPLIMREMVSLFLQNYPDKNLVHDFSTFSFLYGTLPSAPGVFVYATSYGIDTDLVAASMVANTFLSGPLMFISAKMIAASSLNPDANLKLLSAYEFNVSVLSSIGGFLIFFVFAKQKKFRFPHRLTLLLVIAEVIGCVNSILNSYGLSYYNIVVQISSDMCASLCAASLAVALLFIHAHAEHTLNNVQPALILLPWGIPLCLTTILLSLYRHHYTGKLEREAFDMVSTGLYISVLLFSMIVSLICIVLSERNRRQNARSLLTNEDEIPTSISGTMVSGGVSDKSGGNYETMLQTPLIPDLDGADSHYAESIGEDNDFCADDMQLLRHFVFLVLIVCSLMVSLSMSLWELVARSGGLYVEMSFIEITLRRGQAFFAFCIFVLDYKGVIKPSIKWLVKMWYGGEPVTLPKYDALPFETRLICDQFISQYLQKCRVDIEKTKWSSLLYGICFSGSSLVDWLVQNGVVKDNEEAGVYASKLLSGRVIRHIYNTEYFYNSPSILYTFIAGSTGN